MRFLLAGLVALLAACSAGEDTQPALTPVFHETENPPLLSGWGQVTRQGDRLVLADTATPYDLTTPLFSDYAHKLRTVWLPDGQPAQYKEEAPFDFPIGTVITKTFYYPVRTGSPGASGEVLKDETPVALKDHALPLENIRLLETRLLIHRSDGWAALPYVWNEAQTDAALQRTGDLKRLTLLHDGGPSEDFIYQVPNANQCAGCHATNNTTRKIEPIGPKPRHLNRDFAYGSGVENQLVHWRENGLLEGGPSPRQAPRNAVWTDETASLDARARAYLDINCSHCHNRVGPADTSGLHLEPWTPPSPQLGFCKLPIAAGSGTGDRKYDIHPGKPEDSIFIYRMASTDPAAMMPELGRSLAHEEGVALVYAWIETLQGNCK